MLIDLISLMLAAVLIYWAFTLPYRRRRHWRRRLLQRGVKVQGHLYSVERIWFDLMLSGCCYTHKLYAGFEYDGKAYRMVERRWKKPACRAGDSVEICFDPENPETSLIIDTIDKV